MARNGCPDTDEVATEESTGDRSAVIRRELFTAVVGDVMDRMGLHHQFLPASI